MTPKVTVAIPVYNREKMLPAAIRSALRQDIEGLEVIVIDNCSTDATWDVIQSFRDPRLRAFRNSSNLGLFGNFNRCREEVKGEYVRFLCSDDELTERCLTHEVQAMEKNSDAVLLNSRGTVVSPEDKHLYEIGGLLKPGLYPGRDVVRFALTTLASRGENLFSFPSGVLVRKSAMDRAGEFDCDLQGLADVDFWLRILAFGDLLQVQESGCKVLDHGERESYPLLYSGKYIRGQLDLVHKHRADLPDSIRDQAKRALAGRCFWYALKCLKEGRVDSTRIHLRILKEYDLSLATAAFAFINLVRTRILKKSRLLTTKPRLEPR